MSRKVRVAINGFGRIGRQVVREIMQPSAGNDFSADLEVAGINDLTAPKVLVYLLRHDTVHGWFRGEFGIGEEPDALLVENTRIPVMAERDPSNLPWKHLGVDVVLECTGLFAKDGAARAHLAAGAKHVIVSQPTKGDPDCKSYVFGVNHAAYKSDPILDTASCTTNCAAVVIKTLHRAFGVQSVLLNTTHAMTAGQNNVDGIPPGRKAEDLRLGRASSANMVPTSTGAASAVARVLPDLDAAVLDGLSIRVPVLDGSLLDVTAVLKKPVRRDDLNLAFVDAAAHDLHGVLAASGDSIVSSDIIGDTHAAIVDLPLTRVVGGTHVKVMAWYDNEVGYTSQMLRMARIVGGTIR